MGRSLALTNLAVYVAQFGATVAMIDFDLEAPGLHYKIRPGSPLDVGSGGLAALLSSVSAGTPPADLNYDIAIDVSEHVEPPTFAQDDLDPPHGRLLLVPAGDPLQSQYWKDLAQIDWTQLFTAEPRPGVAALARLRQHLIEKYNPDLLLIDSRTGITPSGGVSTTLLPDIVVMLLLNTAEHLDGSRMVATAIAGSEIGEGLAPRVVPVLSRFTSRNFTDQPSELRRRSQSGGRVALDVEMPEEDVALMEIRSGAAPLEGRQTVAGIVWLA